MGRLKRFIEGIVLIAVVQLSASVRDMDSANVFRGMQIGGILRLGTVPLVAMGDSVLILKNGIPSYISASSFRVGIGALGLHDKAASAALADSTAKNAPLGVAQWHVPFSHDGVKLENTPLTYYPEYGNQWMCDSFTTMSFVTYSSNSGITIYSDAKPKNSIISWGFNHSKTRFSKAIWIQAKKTSADSATAWQNLEIVSADSAGNGILQHITIKQKTGEIVFNDTNAMGETRTYKPPRFRNTSIIVDTVPTVTASDYFTVRKDDTIARISAANVLISIGALGLHGKADRTDTLGGKTKTYYDTAGHGSINTAIAGKEPSIPAGTASQFYSWNKSWQSILVSYVTGLTDSLAAKLPLHGKADRTDTLGGKTKAYYDTAGHGSINTAIAGKEPSISAGTASQFYSWNKSWRAILVSYITGLTDSLAKKADRATLADSIYSRTSTISGTSRADSIYVRAFKQAGDSFVAASCTLYDGGTVRDVRTMYVKKRGGICDVQLPGFLGTISAYEITRLKFKSGLLPNPILSYLVFPAIVMQNSVDGVGALTYSTGYNYFFLVQTASLQNLAAGSGGIPPTNISYVYSE